MVVEQDFAVAGEVILLKSGGDRLRVEDAGKLGDEGLSLENWLVFARAQQP